MGDAIKSVTATNIKQRAGFKLTDYLGIGLQALGRRQIVDIYGDLVPLAEYTMVKAPSKVEVSGPEGKAVKIDQSQLSALSDKELETLMSLLSKAQGTKE